MQKREKTSLAAILIAVTACCVAAAVWRTDALPGLKFFAAITAASFAGALVLPYSVPAGMVTGTLALVLLDTLYVGTDLLALATTWLISALPIWVFAVLGKELRLYFSN
jgi:hypothetical protein